MFHAKLKIWYKNFVNWMFWAACFKNHCPILNQRFQVCFTATFGAKIKVLKISDFGYFWAEF